MKNSTFHIYISDYDLQDNPKINIMPVKISVRHFYSQKSVYNARRSSAILQLHRLVALL